MTSTFNYLINALQAKNIAGKLALLLITGVSTLQSHAKPSEAEWKTFNNASVVQFIIPAYEALNSASRRLHNSTEKLCQSPTHESLEQSRKSFHQTMDAWQSVQNITFGPIEFSMRSHSMQFWPDKKNHIGKHLAALIASNKPELLNKDNFQKASISVKGLPAIERILFSKTALTELETNKFHCSVLTTISQNVESISSSLRTEWQEHMRKQFADAKQLDGYFEDDIDAATALLKTMIEPLEVIRDLKLKRPMGSAFGKEKFKRLESWRSQRSLRNIELNIRSLAQMFMRLEALLPVETFKDISLQYQQLNLAITQLNAPLEEAIRTDEGYQAALTISNKISTLHKDLETAITALGIHLGFNSRDGD